MPPFSSHPFSDKVPKPTRLYDSAQTRTYVQNAHGCRAVALCPFGHVERAMKLQLNALCTIKSIREQKEMLTGATCFEIAPVPGKAVTMDEQ